MTYCLTICNRDLRTALTRLRPAIDRRNIIPILGGALFDGATVTGTNLDLTITASLIATDTEQSGGRVAIEYAPLVKFLRAFGVANMVKIEVEASDASARVTCDGTTTKIPTLPSEDFPLVVHTITTGPIDYPARDLHNILKACAFAMSSEDARYYLCGVHLAQEDGRLSFVTTDGHRLARVATKTGFPPEWPQGPGEIIIPSQTILAVVALTKKAGVADSVSLSIGRVGCNYCTLTGPGWSLESKLIVGSFPPYKRVIPAYPKKRVTVDAAGIVKMCAGFIAVTNLKRPPIALNFEALTATATAMATASLPATPAIEGAAPVSIDASYYSSVMTILGAISKSVTQYIMPSAGDPILFEPSEQPAWGDVLAIIMPMRV